MGRLAKSPSSVKCVYTWSSLPKWIAEREALRSGLRDGILQAAAAGEGGGGGARALALGNGRGRF